MEMKSDQSTPAEQPPGYPGPGYPGPGHPAAQAPQGFPMYQSGSTFPAHQMAYGAPPIQGQPNAPPVVWMPAPAAPPKCPPGLEYLTQLDQISIQQQVELLEVMTGFETCNRYEVKNSLGQWVYFAAEENEIYTLNFYGPLRPFTIKLFDSAGQAILELSRSFQCSCCCCPCICCLQELEVQAPPGKVIGYVKQKWHPCLPKFNIQNEAREDVLKMVGPCVPCRCCQDIHFEVKALDGKSAIGRISKQWTGIARESMVDADIFGIQFPMDLDVKMKALMIGACFLVDFMFFERQSNKNNRNRRNARAVGGLHGHRRR